MAFPPASRAAPISRLQKYPWRYLGAIAVVALLQFGIIKLTVSIAMLEDVIIPLWLPAGFSQTAILLFGKSLLPGIGLGTFLFKLSVAQGLLPSLVSALIDTLQVWLALALLQWSGFDRRLSKLKDVMSLFVFGAFLPPVLSATLGGAFLCSTGQCNYGTVWLNWWLGNVAGILTLMPMLLTLGQWRAIAQKRSRFLLEVLPWVALLIAGSWFVFLSPYRQQVAPYPLEYLPFPLIIWGSLRFGQPGAAVAVAVITNLAAWSVISKVSPFLSKTTSQIQAAQAIQLYICVVAFTALVLAAIMTEREEARRQSEQLLLKILPSPIADRLKQGSQTIADSFTQVTVLFADIVNFTAMSANLSPRDLVALLNEIFSTFDELAEKHDLEKIKTIGDAYMVVGGLPDPRDDHAAAVVAMALDMQQAIANFKCRYHDQPFDMRIGINTGPVVAGVIGTKKFLYDLWGDTVNIASRMESQGERGKIQVTESTYLALKDDFEFEPRGVITVKGRGEMMTYWLCGRKKQ